MCFARSEVLNMAAVQTDSTVLSRVKSQLYQSDILSHCVLALDPKNLRGNWSAAATLAQLTRYHPDTFTLFLLCFV